MHITNLFWNTLFLIDIVMCTPYFIMIFCLKKLEFLGMEFAILFVYNILTNLKSITNVAIIDKNLIIKCLRK